MTNLTAIDQKVIDVLRLFEENEDLTEHVLGFLSSGMFSEWDCSLTQGLEAGFGGQELQIAARAGRMEAEFLKKLADYPVEDPCELCGESLVGEEEIGEMHGGTKDRFGNPEFGRTSGGRVHAQCGLDHDWEIS